MFFISDSPIHEDIPPTSRHATQQQQQQQQQQHQQQQQQPLQLENPIRLTTEQLSGKEKLFEKKAVPNKVKKSRSLLSEMIQKEMNKVNENQQQQQQQHPQHPQHPQHHHHHPHYHHHTEATSNNNYHNSAKLQARRKRIQVMETGATNYNDHGHKPLLQQQQQQQVKVAPAGRVGVLVDMTESIKKTLQSEWEPYIRQKKLIERSANEQVDHIDAVPTTYQSACKGW